MSEDEPQTTFFGVWSRSRLCEAKELLNSLGIRFEVIEEGLDRKTLKRWCAWDPAANQPHIGFNLYIWTADLPTLGTKLVEAFPERKFDS